MKLNKVLIPLANDQGLESGVFSSLDSIAKHVDYVRLLGVIGDIAFTEVDYASANSHLQLLDYIEAREHERLEIIKDSLAKLYPHINFFVDVEIGHVFVKIIEVAESDGIDVVIVEANRGHKQRIAHFGSTTRHLMRKSAVPVWTVSQDPEINQIESIVAAVDVSDQASMSHALNEKIIAGANTLANLFRAKLTVLHVWQLPGQNYLKGWGNYTDLEIAKLAKDEGSRRLEECQSLLQNIDDTAHIEIKLVEGVAEVEIPDYVEETRSDLLVMGTLCRTGIPGFIIGNTAESTLDSVNCSVVTLKPDDFKSPVTNH